MIQFFQINVFSPSEIFIFNQNSQLDKMIFLRHMPLDL